mmetsp:Transcript_104/g.91  ORF Transcript_104/g.91 Transcript_104/m.91 type:complete len:185 (+) Transcript_104:44-598(+)
MMLLLPALSFLYWNLSLSTAAAFITPKNSVGKTSLTRQFVSTVIPNYVVTTTTTKKKKKARVVVVGSGRMGEIRSKLIYANPKMELIGIVSSSSNSNLKEKQAMAEEYDTNAYSSIQELVFKKHYLESMIIKDDNKDVAADNKADVFTAGDDTDKHRLIYDATDNIPDIIDGIVCCTPTSTHTH